MPKKNYTCCFTGHRKLPCHDIRQIYARLDDLLDTLISKGVTTFYAGGALGFDTLAALTVLDKKALHPEVKLIVCQPCADQSSKWEESDIAIYKSILSNADEVVCLHDTYTKDCMLERNRYMVDRSELCIAYCTSDSGGSAYTLRYAEKKGLRVKNLAVDINK